MSASFSSVWTATVCSRMAAGLVNLRRLPTAFTSSPAGLGGDAHHASHRLGEGVEAVEGGEGGGVFHAVDDVVEGAGQGGEVFPVDGRDEGAVEFLVEAVAESVGRRFRPA